MNCDSGFHIRFESRLSGRATSVKLWLPDKIFWLPDFTNVKRHIAKLWLSCRASRGQLLVARQEEMVAPGNWATGYVKPCD